MLTDAEAADMSAGDFKQAFRAGQATAPQMKQRPGAGQQTTKPLHAGMFLAYSAVKVYSSPGARVGLHHRGAGKAHKGRRRFRVIDGHWAHGFAFSGP